LVERLDRRSLKIYRSLRFYTKAVSTAVPPRRQEDRSR
jgi:hypothetical protein